MNMPDRTEQVKALANDTRMEILRLLADPSRHFAHQESADPVEFGVCVHQLAKKFSISQPTMSRHLKLLRRAEFISTSRKEKWMYCSRKDAGLNEYWDWMKRSLNIQGTDRTDRRSPIIVNPREVLLEQWEDDAKGAVQWRTLISGDRTASQDLVCGLAYFAPHDTLEIHHHAETEIVHVLKGAGTTYFDDRVTEMMEGTTIYVGRNTPHGWTAGPDGMTLLYTIAASSFSDIRYIFSGNEES